MKRLLSAILALAMILALVPTFALATETEATMDWSQPIRFDFALQTSIDSSEIKDSMNINSRSEFKGGNWAFVMSDSSSGLLNGTKTIKLRVADNVVDYVQFVSSAELVAAGNSNFAIALKVPASGIYNISANVFNSSSCSTTGVVVKNQAKKTNIDIGTIDNAIENEPTLPDGDISKGPRERVFSDGVGVSVAKTENWETVTDSDDVDNHIILTFKEYGGKYSSFIYNFVFTPSTITAASAILSSTETECEVGDTFTPSVALTIDGLSSAKTFEDLDMAGIVLGIKELDAGVTVANNVYTVAESGEVTFTPTVTVNGKTHDAAPITLSVATPVEPEEPEDETADGEVSFAQTTNIDGFTGIDVASVKRGDSVTLTAHKGIPGYKFIGWKRGADTSDENAWVNINGDTYNVWTNTYLTAIYEKETDVTEKTVEFWNQNGAYIGKMDEVTYNAQDELFEPKLTGFGTFLGWITAGNVPFTAKQTLAAGTTNAVAKYEASAISDVTFDGNPIAGADKYNADITLPATSDATTCWKRDGEIIAYGSSYKFNVWDATNITEGTEKIEKKVPVAIFDYSANHKAYMLEYDAGDYEIVEAGIIFGKGTVNEKRYTSQRKEKHNQFTVLEEGVLEATGYIIYTLDGGVSYKTKYVSVKTEE